MFPCHENGSPQESAAEPKDTLSSKQVKELVANAKTPADHLKLAHHYAAMAQKHEAEATEHEALAAEYTRNPQLGASKHPMSANTAEHCKFFAEHCREWEHSRQVGACSVPLGLSPSAEGSRRRARESWMTSARRAMHTECSRGPFASTPPFRSLGETGSAGNAQRCTGSGHMLVGPGALWGRAHSLYLLREAR